MVAMNPLAKPMSPLARVCTWALRSYLCVFLTGCAAHRLALPETPATETHLVRGDERTAFRACVDALLEAGYEVDVSEASEGILRGSLVTERKLGVIEDGQEPSHALSPGAQVGLLVLTGAALVVGGLAVLAKGMKAPTKPIENVEEGDSSDGAIAAAVGVGLAMLDVGTSLPKTIYEYEIAIQFLPMEGNTTQVRVLLDGSENQEGEVLRSGPVNAPDFLDRLYSALDQATKWDPEPERDPATVVTIH